MSKFIQHNSGSGAPMRVIAESAESFTVVDPKSGMHYMLRRQEYEVVPEPVAEPVVESVRTSFLEKRQHARVRTVGF